MRQLRNSGHILCLKQGHARREFCEGAFRKLPQLSSNYTLTNGTTGNEFAYRILYANETYEKKPQIVFACGCPTDPIGIFLMGWINNKDAVVEVLDYQFSRTAPLEKYIFKGLSKDNIPLEDMRKQFLVSFEKGQNYLLQKYDKRMQQTAR